MNNSPSNRLNGFYLFDGQSITEEPMWMQVCRKNYLFSWHCCAVWHSYVHKTSRWQRQWVKIPTPLSIRPWPERVSICSMLSLATVRPISAPTKLASSMPMGLQISRWILVLWWPRVKSQSHQDPTIWVEPLLQWTVFIPTPKCNCWRPTLWTGVLR